MSFKFLKNLNICHEEGRCIRKNKRTLIAILSTAKGTVKTVPSGENIRLETHLEKMGAKKQDIINYITFY